MKHEWRKKEKATYIPSVKPEIIQIPEYQFVSLSGEGNPNTKIFEDHIVALYSVSYAIKMGLKKAEQKPANYYDWTVYPLEGVWDISDIAKQNYTGTLNKDELVFELMIRQPDFITDELFTEMLDVAKEKKKFKLLDKVQFKKITEGKCVQALHIGSYDNEPESFDRMEQFAKENNVTRKSKIHREIYISDFRKVPTEKLKTTLRFQLKQ